MHLDVQSSRYVSLILTNTRGFTQWPQIYTGKVPYAYVKPKTAVQDAITQGGAYPQPDEISSDPLWILVQQCIAYEPGERPDAARVKASLAEM